MTTQRRTFESFSSRDELYKYIEETLKDANERMKGTDEDLKQMIAEIKQLRNEEWRPLEVSDTRLFLRQHRN